MQNGGGFFRKKKSTAVCDCLFDKKEMNQEKF